MGIYPTSCASKISALIITVFLLQIVPQPAVAQDEVTRADLSHADATAELLLQKDRGFQVESLDVKSDGKTPKFTIKFKKSNYPTHGNIAASPREFDERVQGTHQRKGAYIKQAKGYVVDGQVWFVIIIEEVGPPGSPAKGFKALKDIPAPEFAKVVELEAQAGGRLVDKSTYQPPNAPIEFHTALFHAR